MLYNSLCFLNDVYPGVHVYMNLLPLLSMAKLYKYYFDADEELPFPYNTLEKNLPELGKTSYPA